MDQAVTLSKGYLHIIIDLVDSKHLSENLRFRSPKLRHADLGNLNIAKFIPEGVPILQKAINFSDRQKPEFSGYRIRFPIAFDNFDTFNVSYLIFNRFNRFCHFS